MSAILPLLMLASRALLKITRSASHVASSSGVSMGSPLGRMPQNQTWRDGLYMTASATVWNSVLPLFSAFSVCTSQSLSVSRLSMAPGPAYITTLCDWLFLTTSSIAFLTSLVVPLGMMRRSHCLLRKCALHFMAMVLKRLSPMNVTLRDS